jgi:hypothetical protein
VRGDFLQHRFAQAVPWVPAVTGLDRARQHPADRLYTSVLVQMWRGLAAAPVPAQARNVRAWRRSWLLGFTTAVVHRVRAAEQCAAQQAATPEAESGSRAELVLADRQLVIQRNLEMAYPVTRRSRITYTGSGYGDGYSKGTQADLGGARLRGTTGPALGSDR